MRRWEDDETVVDDAIDTSVAAAMLVLIIVLVGGTVAWAVSGRITWDDGPIPAETVTVTETVTVHASSTFVDGGRTQTPEPLPTLTEQSRASTWDALAQCESGGDWHEGDGGLGEFRGGLQWTANTWGAVKSPDAPHDPALATREQEIDAANTLMAEPWGGYQHWPTCARRLGLIS